MAVAFGDFHDLRYVWDTLPSSFDVRISIFLFLSTRGRMEIAIDYRSIVSRDNNRNDTATDIHYGNDTSAVSECIDEFDIDIDGIDCQPMASRLMRAESIKTEKIKRSSNKDIDIDEIVNDWTRTTIDTHQRIIR